MGVFKFGDNTQSIGDYLIEDGFELGSGVLPGQEGYLKAFCGSFYCLWVTFDLDKNKCYMYKEYDCGGKIWSREEDIPKDVLLSVDSFERWCLANVMPEIVDIMN